MKFLNGNIFKMKFMKKIIINIKYINVFRRVNFFLKKRFELIFEVLFKIMIDIFIKLSELLIKSDLFIIMGDLIIILFDLFILLVGYEFFN